MALKFIERIENNSGNIVLVFEGGSKELEQNVNNFFLARKYKLKSGENNNAVYEKGNYVMRILFGAFVAYYKFSVIIKQEENRLMLHLLKAHSGFSGGAIGVAKLKKEYHKIAAALENADSALGIYAE